MLLLQLEYANCDTLVSQSWCGVFFMFFLTFAASGSLAAGLCCSLLWLRRLSSYWVCWAEVWWVQYFRSSPPGLEQTPSTPVRPLCEQLCPGLTHPATTWPSNSPTQYLQAEPSSFPALRSIFIWALCSVTRWPTQPSVTQWMYWLSKCFLVWCECSFDLNNVEMHLTDSPQIGREAILDCKLWVAVIPSNFSPGL